MLESAIRRPARQGMSADSVKRPDAAERRLRQIGAWSMLYLLLQAELGLAWDRQWHDLVGRDRFWIPPHILLYTGVGAAGLVALLVVLIDSRRYRRGKVGADDESTVSIFRVFHGPLGFVILGFGALTDLLAAPLDNYWHQLYGIDVTLWSPFHIMGTIGGLLIGFGIIYIFASEAAHERAAEGPARSLLGLNGPEWGAIIFLAAFMELGLPALTAFAPLSLGAITLSTYPLLLSLAAAALIAAYQITHKSGTALITAVLLWLLCLGTQAFIPWALNFAVARYGFSFRVAGGPVFNYAIALMPALFLLCALLVEGNVLWQRWWRQRTMGDMGSEKDLPLHQVWLVGLLMACLTPFLPAVIVYTLLAVAPGLLLPADVVRVLVPSLPGMLVSLPFALLVGAGAALLGSGVGDIWYRSKL